MVEQSHHFYEFGPFRVDPVKRLLLRQGRTVHLTPKAFDLLLALVESAGEVISKDELMKRVWPDSFVEEGNLTYNMSILRKALGERAGEHQYIVTVPGRGYQFVASISETKSEPTGPGERSEPLLSEPLLTAGGSADQRETDPALPNRKPLAAFIHRRKAVLVAAAAFGIIIVIGVSLKNLWGETDGSERISVMVVDFANETNEDDLNGLSGMLITSLEQSRHLSVLTRARLFDILKQMGKGNTDKIDESLGREICNRANISALAIASIRNFDGLYTIDLKVLDPQKNEYICTAKEEAEGKSSIPGMIDRLSEKTRAGLREKAAEIQKTRQKVADVTTPNLAAYRHYFLGEQLYNKFKLEEAVEEFNRAIALDPTFALAYYQLASTLAWSNLELSREPIQKAIQYIEKAPEKARLMIRAWNAYVNANPDEAIALCRDALNFYPTDKEVLWMLADLSFHKGDHTTSLSHLEKVLDLDPQFGPAVEHIVWLFREAGSYDKMLEYAKQYVEKIPDDQQAYMWLGEAYNLKADFEAAFQSNRRFLELFPRSSLPIRAMGMMYIFKNEYDKAALEFKKLLDETRPMPQRVQGYRSLALANAYMGKYREAVKMADRAVDLSLKSADADLIAEAYGDKAYWLLAGHNQREEARKTIDKATELKAGNNFFHFRVFNIYLILGEYEKTYPIIKGHLLTLSPSGDRTVEAHTHRATGEYDAAIRAFETIIERGFAMDRIPRGYELAQCYFETGRNDEAIEAIAKMQNLYAFFYTGFPQSRAAVYPRSFHLLGRIYEQKGDKRSAIENYEMLLSLWKEGDDDLPELIEAKSRLARLKKR
jgi:DNA-binding winged helix-turn-helix (wHTH) protein/tetratricopeptide (TPR) repeat protein